MREWLIMCFIDWLIDINALKLTKKVVEGDTDYDIVWLFDDRMNYLISEVI